MLMHFLLNFCFCQVISDFVLLLKDELLNFLERKQNYTVVLLPRVYSWETDFHEYLNIWESLDK